MKKKYFYKSIFLLLLSILGAFIGIKCQPEEFREYREQEIENIINNTNDFIKQGNKYIVNGPDSQIVFDLKEEQGDVLRIGLECNEADYGVQVYWKGPNDEFKEEQSVIQKEQTGSSQVEVETPISEIDSVRIDILADSGSEVCLNSIALGKDKISVEKILGSRSFWAGMFMGTTLGIMFLLLLYNEGTERIIREKSYFLIFLSVALFVILFWDVLFDGYSVSWMNTAYITKPFSSIGVSVKGPFLTDISDNILPMVYALKTGSVGIDSWNIWNVFGENAINSNYILNPFFIFFYVLGDNGEVIRYIAKCIIGLLGMFAFLRKKELSKEASFLGGILYVFSSAMITWSGWSHTDVSCLAPVLFWLVDLLMEGYASKQSKKCYVKYSVAIILILYVMLIAGMPTYVAYFIYLGFFYFIYRMLVVFGNSIRQMFIVFANIVVCMITAGLMSFVYTGKLYLSTTGYQAEREGRAKEFLNIECLRTALFPFWEDGFDIHINEACIYSGMLFLFLIILFFCVRKRKESKFWAGSILVLLVLIFTEESGVVYQYLPLINSSYKYRVIILLNFSVAIFSAMCIDYISKENISTWCYDIGVFIVAAGVTIGTVVSVKDGKWKLLTYKKEQFLFQILCLWLVAIGLIWLKQRRSVLAKYFTITVLCVEAVLTARAYLPLVERQNTIIPEPTEAVQWLQKEENQGYRMIALGKWNFYPNLNMFYEIRDLRGHVLDNTRSEVKYYLESIDNTCYDTTTRTSLEKIDNLNLLSYANVKYVMIENEELDQFQRKYGDKIEKIMDFDDGEIVIELKDSAEWVYLANRVIESDSAEVSIEKMSKEYLPNTVFLEKGRSRFSNATMKNYEISKAEYKNNKMSIELKVDGSGYVVFNEAYNEGWRVTVNGESKEIQKVNGVFQAVWLDDAGSYDVEFEYSSSNKYIWVSVCGVVVVVVILLFRRKINDSLIYFNKLQNDGGNER